MKYKYNIVVQLVLADGRVVIGRLVEELPYIKYILEGEEENLVQEGEGGLLLCINDSDMVFIDHQMIAAAAAAN